MIRSTLYGFLILVTCAQAGTEPTTVWTNGNGNTFEFVSVPGGIRWDQSRAAAIDRGGHLATLTSAAEADFVSDWVLGIPGAFDAGGPWIGAYQRTGIGEPSGDWQWVTGETVEYARWAEGQPDNVEGGEHYLRLGGAGAQWYDDATMDDPTWASNANMPGYIVEYPVDKQSRVTVILDSVADAVLREKDPDDNFDDEVLLRLTAFNSSWEGGGNGRARGIISFESLPPANGANVCGAWIEIYQSNRIIYPGFIIAEEVSEAWDESTVTWNSQPATSGPIASALNSSRRLMRLDGPALVASLQDVYDTSRDFYGVLIRFDNENYNGNPNGTRGDGYRAREDSLGPTPRLFIEYCICLADLNGDLLLDLNDINLFVGSFILQNGAADIAEPFGVYDLNDIVVFIESFNAGCS